MLTVALRARRGLSWELSPSSSPVLGKANGYTGNIPWDALGRQLKQVLASSCSGSDLRSSALGILLCTGLGRVPEQVWGAWASLQSAAGWALWTEGAWEGAPLLGSAQSLLEPWQCRGTGDALREWFDTCPTQCAESLLLPCAELLV